MNKLNYKNAYDKWYWSNRTDNELRRTMYDDGQLDSERRDARIEMTRRTHKQTIDDTLTRRITIA